MLAPGYVFVVRVESLCQSPTGEPTMNYAQATSVCCEHCDRHSAEFPCALPPDRVCTHFSQYVESSLVRTYKKMYDALLDLEAEL
jgi:hypothetical protein